MLSRVVVVVLIVVLLVFGISVVYSAYGDPGTVQDPLISKSYLEEYIEKNVLPLIGTSSGEGDVLVVSESVEIDFTNEVQAYIDKVIEDKIAHLEISVSSESGLTGEDIKDIFNYVDRKVKALESDIASSGTSGRFEVVQIFKGQKVLCSSGTEIIPRQTGARVYSQTEDGLADATSGSDIKNGNYIPNGHLVIVPRDGRGFVAMNDMWLLIRGEFEVVEN